MQQCAIHANNKKPARMPVFLGLRQAQPFKQA